MRLFIASGEKIPMCGIRKNITMADTLLLIVPENEDFVLEEQKSETINNSFGTIEYLECPLNNNELIFQEIEPSLDLYDEIYIVGLPEDFFSYCGKKLKNKKVYKLKTFTITAAKLYEKKSRGGKKTTAQNNVQQMTMFPDMIIPQSEETEHESSPENENNPNGNTPEHTENKSVQNSNPDSQDKPDAQKSGAEPEDNISDDAKKDSQPSKRLKEKEQEKETFDFESRLEYAKALLCKELQKRFCEHLNKWCFPQDKRRPRTPFPIDLVTDVIILLLKSGTVPGDTKEEDLSSEKSWENALEDFRKSWKCSHETELKLDLPAYKKLYSEATYYEKLTNYLYEEDVFDE